MSAPAPLRVVVLGLSLSSSWGNGHATTYRALLRAFSARGHDVLFLERDTPWYARHRDLERPRFCRLALYRDVAGLAAWRDTIATADAVIVGSYVPDGMAVGEMVLETAAGVTAFYDIDTPVTLAKLARHEDFYIGQHQIPRYDLYFSFTGGPTLNLLEGRYGARAARQLYCSVDPDAYRPAEQPPRWDLSYLGTYSPDRQPVLDRLLLEPARRAPALRFAVAGPQYPADIQWPANVQRIDHLPPDAHADFYNQSRFTLNVTRAAMVRHGYSPSVRLFEASACGTAILSDVWEGLDTILAPGTEILQAQEPEQVLDALQQLSEGERRAIGQAARARILRDHTASRRAAELERHLHEAVAARAGTRVAVPRRIGQTLSVQVSR